MRSLTTKMLVVLLAAAMLFGLISAPVAQAQGGATYTKTFDLTLPLADGKYAGVDPKGTTVTWWHQHTGAREEVVKRMVEKFNAENPFGITVEAVSKGSYDDIFNAVTAGIQTGELPEIVVAYGNQAAAYQDNNALIDLNEFVTDPALGLANELESDLFASFFASDVRTDRDNQRLGYSTYRSMEVLYYNVDALTAMGFDGPPQTWEQFREQVCKFVKDGLGTDGYQIRTDASFIAAGAFAAGGDIFNQEEDRFTYDSAEAKILPQTMQDLLKEGCVKITVDPRARSDQAAFANGQALFYTGSSSGIPFIADAVKQSPKPFVFDIAPIPGWTEQPIQNVYGASNSVVATGKTPAEILASWLFLRWFSETEPQAEWAAGTNYFPVRRSSADAMTTVFEAELTGRPYKSAFDLLGSTKEEPSVAVYQTVRSETGKAFNNILDGANVDEEMARLNELANQLHEEARAKEGAN